jgi:hypothetical protein
MKIRIKGNSLRYRLTKTDVETLTGMVTWKKPPFWTQVFKYALQRSTLNFNDYI